MEFTLGILPYFAVVVFWLAIAFWALVIFVLVTHENDKLQDDLGGIISMLCVIIALLAGALLKLTR